MNKQLKGLKDALSKEVYHERKVGVESPRLFMKRARYGRRDMKALACTAPWAAVKQLSLLLSGLDANATLGIWPRHLEHEPCLLTLLGHCSSLCEGLEIDTFHLF